MTKKVFPGREQGEEEEEEEEVVKKVLGVVQTQRWKQFIVEMGVGDETVCIGRT
jgi:hypothetical protein